MHTKTHNVHMYVWIMLVMSNLLAQDIAVGWRVKEEGGIGLTKAKLCTNATKGDTVNNLCSACNYLHSFPQPHLSHSQRALVPW